MVTDLSPFLRWTLALIAGGMAAGSVQGATVAGRALSLATTGGLANPVVATMEWGGALAVSVLAIALPVGLCLMLAAGGVYALKVWQAAKRARMPVTP
jgi:hypothetical protein